MNKKLLALYSLKFNPFLPDIPVSALLVTPAIESFCWRMQNQVGEGGFAMVSGQPGTGKSAALRILVDRLADLRDASVGVLTRPQASVADFYRELGHLFKVALTPHNRWNGAKASTSRSPTSSTGNSWSASAGRWANPRAGSASASTVRSARSARRSAATWPPSRAPPSSTGSSPATSCRTTTGTGNRRLRRLLIDKSYIQVFDKHIKDLPFPKRFTEKIIRTLK